MKLIIVTLTAISGGNLGFLVSVVIYNLTNTNTVN